MRCVSVAPPLKQVLEAGEDMAQTGGFFKKVWICWSFLVQVGYQDTTHVETATWGVSSMGLPSLCPDEAGLAKAVGDMACGPSEVEIALMRELSCASVIAPSVPCAQIVCTEPLQLEGRSNTSGIALVSIESFGQNS